MKSFLVALMLLGAACNDGEGYPNPAPIPDGGEREIMCDGFVPACDSHLEACETVDDCCDSKMFPDCGAAWLCEPCCTTVGLLTEGTVCVSR